MEVEPKTRNIKEVFNHTVYYIDFYQRQYKWGAEPVKKLMEDIFYRFNGEYEKRKDDDRNLKDCIYDYGWYYLNCFVTNQIGGKTYIVDGQQRLTTLALILMKLRAMSLDEKRITRKFHLLNNLIIGIDDNDIEYFWVNHESQKETLQDIYQNGNMAVAHDNSITAQNLVCNYKAIDSILDSYLPLENNRRFEAFVLYFINRIILIQLDIQQDDVPMLFEVINDRGVRLKPYEILKGKLLGQLTKEELGRLKINEEWDERMERLGSLDWYSTDERNEFFINYLRAKFADSLYDGKKVDSSTYHRYIMGIEQLHLTHDAPSVISFLKNDFRYYTELYWKIRCCKYHEDTPYKELFYLSLNGQDSVLMLILSACNVNDKAEEEKIRIISYEYDRFYSLLQLQRAYNWNEIAGYIYEISREIRNNSLDKIRYIFDSRLILILRKHSGNTEIVKVWNYSLFRNSGYDNIDTRFLRYALARVEMLICNKAKIAMQHSIKDIVQNRKCAFHIEHILANNEENRRLFKNEESFLNERNRLGDLLILKGKDNQGSGNESYAEKLKTYSGTLYWNSTLIENTYVHNIDLTRWIKEKKLNLHPIGQFGPNEIEERQRLLFDLFDIIWNQEKNE